MLLQVDLADQLDVGCPSEGLTVFVPDLHIVCMKEASTFDGQLSPVCPWCGQRGWVPSLVQGDGLCTKLTIVDDCVA